nr:hypothetical protein [Tanacetum cinerariifolium]
GELTLLKSIPPRIDETDCYHENEIRLTKRLLYDNSSPRLPEEFVSVNSNAEIGSFSPSPIRIEDSDSPMEEIDLSFTPDDPMLPGIEEDDYDSERDIPILEELLRNDSLSLPDNESFYFDIHSLSRPPAKPPDASKRTLEKVVKQAGTSHSFSPSDSLGFETRETPTIFTTRILLYEAEALRTVLKPSLSINGA